MAFAGKIQLIECDAELPKCPALWLNTNVHLQSGNPPQQADSGESIAFTQISQEGCYNLEMRGNGGYGGGVLAAWAAGSKKPKCLRRHAKCYP